MKVLHILNDLSSGGAERLVLELCRRRAADIEVAVATVAGLGPLEDAFRGAGIPLLVGGRPPRHVGLRVIARLARAMDDIDVVHTHLFAGDTWGRLAAIAARARAAPGGRRPIVVTTEHNVNRDETWQRGVKRALAPVSDAIVCVSEAAAAYTRDVEGISGVRVLPNGIDRTRFGPHRGSGAGGSDGTRALAIGRRVPQKGFDVLVAALPEGMHLDIVGEGPWHVEHPRVRFLGRREDVPALLADADILVVPSRWEGFGLAAAEGLAAGVAVVASDVDGLREVVGDAGLLVPPGDVTALHHALVRLAADPTLRRALGDQGRARVAARFDIRDTVDRYERLYRELALRCSIGRTIP
jgi:glycosyltransferase involved in cell wall biosynthesis